MREGYRMRRPHSNPKGKGVERNPPIPRPEVNTQQAEPPNNLQNTGLEEFQGYQPEQPDEEMPDEGDIFSSNFIPPNFLPGPGLSKEEAFNKTAASIEAQLAKLGILISVPQHTEVDRASETNEIHRRSLITAASTEAKEAELFVLAEGVSIAPTGYFHPRMDETKHRQLAAIVAAGPPQFNNLYTPGIASTSTASFSC